MNNPTFFRLSSGLYINIHQITCLWPENSPVTGQLMYKFNLAGEPDTEYNMTLEEFNQIVDL
jgi:uncharacterized membrane protein YfhO